MNASPDSASKWVAALIGIPWKLGGRDLKGFDCYGLLWYVYHNHFGLTLAEHPERQSANLIANHRLASEELGADHWQPVASPAHGDMVAMSSGKRLVHHTGVFLAVDGGLILHAMDKGNVIAQSPSNLYTLGLHVVGYYHHVDMPSQ